MLLPTRAQERGMDGGSDRSGQARICTSTGGMQILLRVERGEIFSDAEKKKAEWADGAGSCPKKKGNCRWENKK